MLLLIQLAVAVAPPLVVAADIYYIVFFPNVPSISTVAIVHVPAVADVAVSSHNDNGISEEHNMMMLPQLLISSR